MSDDRETVHDLLILRAKLRNRDFDCIDVRRPDAKKYDRNWGDVVLVSESNATQMREELILRD